MMCWEGRGREGVCRPGIDCVYTLFQVVYNSCCNRIESTFSFIPGRDMWSAQKLFTRLGVLPALTPERRGTRANATNLLPWTATSPMPSMPAQHLPLALFQPPVSTGPRRNPPSPAVIFHHPATGGIISITPLSPKSAIIPRPSRRSRPRPLKRTPTKPQVPPVVPYPLRQRYRRPHRLLVLARQLHPEQRALDRLVGAELERLCYLAEAVAASPD